MEERKCLTAACGNKEPFGRPFTRGLCSPCYASFIYQRKKGTFTDDEAVAMGIVAPKKNARSKLTAELSNKEKSDDV